MAIPPTLISLCLALLSPASPTGTIGGVVVDAADGRPMTGAEVVLRVTIEGRLVPAEEAVADAHGRFQFAGLPASAEYVYLPGANCDGVHYPGSRLTLTPLQPDAEVRLEVCRAVAEPNPLVVRRHHIVVEPQSGSLRVSETLLVDNPTPTCFVGRAQSDGAEPITLRLSIPPNFERATFAEEFFGRRFVVAGGQLVTSIPFTPGQREIALTYTMPCDASQAAWERPLDLPTEALELTIRTDKPDEVVCNLERQAAQAGEVVFRGDPGELPAGEVLRVQFGAAPISWRAYAPWLALAVLSGLIGATGLTMFLGRRRRHANQAVQRPAEDAARNPTRPPHSRRKQNRRPLARD